MYYELKLFSASISLGVKEGAIIMTRDELIAYIQTEQRTLMENIDSEDERVIQAYAEYDKQVKKILAADLSKENIKDCFMELNELYLIKSNDFSSGMQEKLSINEEFDPKTKEELLKGLEDTIDSMKDFSLFSTYADLSVHSATILHKSSDLKALLKEVEERLKKQEELGMVTAKKDPEPEKTEEEQQKERIALLESIIGEQEEFNTIMGR